VFIRLCVLVFVCDIKHAVIVTDVLCVCTLTSDNLLRLCYLIHQKLLIEMIFS